MTKGDLFLIGSFIWNLLIMTSYVIERSWLWALYFFGAMTITGSVILMRGVGR